MWSTDPDYVRFLRQAYGPPRRLTPARGPSNASLAWRLCHE